MVMKLNAIRERIRNLPPIAGIPEDEFDCLFREMTVRELAPAEVFIVEGEPAEVAYLILEGEVEIIRSAGDGEVVVATRAAGELVGEMALLMEARRNATVRARGQATVIEIAASAFATILAAHPATSIAMLRTVWQRLQAAEAHLVQHQKMAALGTLAAGLAHELNNPAAALVRSAGQLSGTLFDWERHAEALGGLNLSDAERAAVDALRRSLDDAPPVDSLDPLDRADLEEAVADWLAARAIARPWQLAPLLVDAGATPEKLERTTERVRPEHLPALLWWFGNGVLVQRLLQELAVSARAISEIVTAVKGYTRLDQASIQEIDIHEGIEQAMVILRHKLKGIEIRRDYAGDLPRITALAGELNQIWANLIDNAADALDGSGTLTLRTRLGGSEIVVEIEDDGPGIPEELRTRLFDPFFTTKPPGMGSGLGLAISFNIVRNHGGDIRLDTEPGRTRFAVRLPLESDIERRAGLPMREIDDELTD